MRASVTRGCARDGRREATIGMTIAAATRCVATRVSFVAMSVERTRSGTTESAVSASVTLTKVAWGWLALRRRTAASATPMAVKNSVSWPKPSAGICSPGAVSSETPAAWAPAAMAVVAAAARTPAVSPARRSEGRREVEGSDWTVSTVVAAEVIVAVIEGSSGLGARSLRPSPPPRTGPREIDRRSRRTFNLRGCTAHKPRLRRRIPSRGLRLVRTPCTRPENRTRAPTAPSPSPADSSVTVPRVERLGFRVFDEEGAEAWPFS